MNEQNTRQRTSGVLFALLLLISAVTCSHAQSSVEELRAWQRIEQERLADIEAEAAANGPLSSELYEQYFALALLYRERDDHLSATATLEQALHIQRVTHGLFSPEQIAVVRELRTSSLLLGDLERVVQLDGQLMRIALQNPEHRESAGIHLETAERQLDVYRRYLAGDLPPEVSISFSSFAEDGPGMGRNHFMANANLSAARGNFAQAIALIADSKGSADPQILEIEHQILESYYLEANSRDVRPNSNVSTRLKRESDRRAHLFRLGRNSYGRMLRYAIDTENIEVAADSMVGLADWHLMFDRLNSALRIYSDAYDTLVRLGASDEILDEIFAPDVPVALPAFEPNPFVDAQSADADAAAEFLQIRIRMNRFGRSRIRAIEPSGQAIERSTEKRVRRILATSRFRPMLIDGESQGGQEYEFRYYLDAEKS